MTTPTANLEQVQLEITAPLARITLRNPPLNVITIPMMHELTAALNEIEAQPQISTVVIQGAGKSFSAGVDVAAHTSDQVRSMLERFHAVIRALVTTKKVTIAAVQSHCLGGGAELAMVCDVVITTENTNWGFPEITLAAYPPVAVTALSALIGHKRAAELILTGRSISGVAAAEMGLATEAVPEGDLHDAVAAVADRLQKLSPAALAITKRAIYAWDSIHFDKGLARAEKIYLEELMQTEDAHEGIKAFLEKREPKWKSK